MVDFHRVRQVRQALELDPVLGKVAEASADYVRAAIEILKLPVAAWDCPTTAAGEIDTERKRNMSWNQQGNGNGYGQQQPQQQQGYVGGDTYARLDSTKPIGGARFPFIEPGKHKLAVVTMEEFDSTSDGPSARCLFEVLESTNQQAHPVGSYVVKIYKIAKPSKYPNSAQGSDADQFVDMCRKLKGAPDGTPISNDIRILMRERVREQLARGTVIECLGIGNKKGNWVNLYWKAVQQSPQDIAAMRGRIEAKGVPDTGSGNAQPPAAAPQYQAPQQQPQYQAPQQQYQQPAQGGYPMQNPVPQQQYVQQPPQQAPVAAPQGGFLAQLPPQGGGSQGGNTGGGW